MNTEISALNLDPNNTNDKSLKFQVQLPNKCPLCSTAYSSKPVSSWFFKNDLGVVDLYAISIHPEHKSQIESSQLARCIADFIDNEKIKTLAKASAWLGNDETHYIRKHQNHNIQDLKRFIKATVAYIDSEFSFTEAFEFLNNSQQ